MSCVWTSAPAWAPESHTAGCTYREKQQVRYYIIIINIAWSDVLPLTELHWNLWGCAINRNSQIRRNNNKEI